MSLLKELQSLKKRYIKEMDKMVFSECADRYYPDDLVYDKQACLDKLNTLENELKRVNKFYKRAVKKYTRDKLKGKI